MVMDWDYLVGDVREVLRTLPEQSIQCIVTSPPYWGLRDYGIPPSIWGGDSECEHEWGEEISGGEGHQGKRRWQHVANESEGKVRDASPDSWTDVKLGGYCLKCGAWRGCLGLEPTPELYIDNILKVGRELWRVLRDDGTFWLNLGDSYASGGRGHGGKSSVPPGQGNSGWHSPPPGLKPKDLVMMPHRVAIALQNDGWYVRSTIVWSKPNPMPQSCRDRPTNSHEYIFLLTKKQRYFYDAEAVREENQDLQGMERFAKGTRGLSSNNFTPRKKDGLANEGFPTTYRKMGRNLRNVWQITTQAYPDAHFATFPEKIPETCIKAGTSEWGCCPGCGAPWERVVEKGEPNEEWKAACGADSKGEYHGQAIKSYDGTKAENPSDVKARILEGMRERRTTSWRSTCECPPKLNPVPCTVLDPFAGSGTTLKVARNLGRSAIGVDISAEFKELAEERAMLNIPDIESFG